MIECKPHLEVIENVIPGPERLECFEISQRIRCEPIQGWIATGLHASKAIESLTAADPEASKLIQAIRPDFSEKHMASVAQIEDAGCPGCLSQGLG